MTCNSTSSSERDLQDLPPADPSFQGDWTVWWPRHRWYSGARPVGKSMLRHLYYEMMARRYLGELSSIIAKGAVPHSSPAILQAASTRQKAWILNCPQISQNLSFDAN